MKIKKSHLNKIRLFAIAVLSGLIFLGIFIKEYQEIEPELYKHRDDGIITMSHAKNLVDYGFVGVSPSGEKVEGYSAPLHFFTYAFSYKITGVDYKTFNDAKLYITTFLIGVTIFALIKLFNKNLIVNALLVAVSAVLMTRSATFLEWHASGMENDLTHFFYLFSFFLLLKSFVKNKIYYLSIPVLFLASISRSESIFYILPFVAVYSVAYYLNYKDINIIKFFSLFLLSWFLYFALHNFYFENLLPNTAFAQDISMFDNLKKLLEKESNFTWNFDIVSQSISKNLGLYYLMTIPLFALLRYTRKVRFSIIFFSIPLLLIILHAFLFANTRLDTSRSTTFLTVFASTFFVLMLSQIRINIYLKIFVIILFFTPIVSILLPRTPYWLCCAEFKEIRGKLIGYKEEHELYRPLVANPDLGTVSYYKYFNILDIGYLGSPFLAHNSDNPDAIAEYFYRIAQPDLIETHNIWTCMHEEIFNDPRFIQLYEGLEVYDENCPNYANSKSGYFIRKDIMKDSETKERILIDKLRDDLKLSAISNGFNECNSSEQKDSCMYVIRTLYRFLPEFRVKYTEQELLEAVEVLGNEEQKELAKAVVTCHKNPSLYINIADYLNNT